MVSTFTPNVQLEEPARGDDVGTWDTPVNSNMTVVDLVVGAINTIGLNNSPVVLAAAQYRSKQITFNSTLTGSCAITFPTSFTKSYEIQNLCTGSSAFVITLGTTALGGQVICCPPGEIIDVVNDGTNLKFKNFGRIGSYWDFAGSSVPAWVAGCTVAPWLNCDGTAFSSATFPQLATILGGTTLPDARGRYRAVLNQGQARITSGTSLGGVDGNTLFAAGGAQVTTLSSQQIPPVLITDPGHKHVTERGISQTPGTTGPIPNSEVVSNVSSFTGVTLTGITAGTSNPTVVALLPPTYVGGLTLIRSA